MNESIFVVSGNIGFAVVNRHFLIKRVNSMKITTEKWSPAQPRQVVNFILFYYLTSVAFMICGMLAPTPLITLNGKMISDGVFLLVIFGFAYCIVVVLLGRRKSRKEL